MYLHKGELDTINPLVNSLVDCHFVIEMMVDYKIAINCKGKEKKLNSKN